MTTQQILLSAALLSTLAGANTTAMENHILEWHNQSSASLKKRMDDCKIKPPFTNITLVKLCLPLEVQANISSFYNHSPMPSCTPSSWSHKFDIETVNRQLRTAIRNRYYSQIKAIECYHPTPLLEWKK